MGATRCWSLALAGLAGGLFGLVAGSPGYPIAPFFAVSVLIINYHLFSEFLSLLVKTRSSQAVRRLLELQPDTARVVRDDVESRRPGRSGRDRRPGPHPAR